MSTGFDPYHAWLGLPPGSRPTNHYELLGLKLFTSEPPIIAEAADERLAKVREQLNGPHAAVAKPLFEQLTAARAELISAASRRAYEAQLRVQLGMAPAADARPAAAAPARPAAPAMPPGVQLPPAAAPVAPQAVAAVAMPAMPPQAMPPQTMPMPAVPMAAMPVAAVPMAGQPMAVQAMPAAMPMAQAMPVAAQAMPVAAQAMPMAPGMMPGYAPGVPMAQPAAPMAAMPLGYGAPVADAGFDDVGGRRRSHRRASGGQMIAIVGVLLVVGGVCAVGYLKRDDLMAALEDKPQVVIREGDEPAETTPAKQPAKESTESSKPAEPKQVATREPAKAPPPEQMATNMPVRSEPPPRKPARPKNPNAVKLKPKAPAVVSSISIKPQSPQEKAAVGKSLAGVRAALAERNQAKVEEQFNLAMLEASSSESMAAISRMRTLDDSVKEFWHAVHESVKGLQAVDEIEVDGKKMIVVDADNEHLSVRADGKIEDYKIEKLPFKMALQLAEQWLQPNDPNSKVVLGAFLAVEHHGNRQQARQLWQEAAGQGSEVAKTLLAQDSD